MSEEPRDNKITTNKNNRCPENGWIVCRSKKRPGLYYDFNTATGEAFWRDSDNVEPHQTAMLDHSERYECQEPTYPPSESAYRNQHKVTVTQKTVTPKIYNKQVINNQFPAKTFPIAPFGHAPCTQYGVLNPNNNIPMNHTPVWLFPPTPRVGFFGPTVAPLNPVQSIYESFQNIQLQNTTVPLSSRFQVLNQLNNENPASSQQGVQSMCPTTPRKNADFVKTYQNPPNDLRSLLSERRRQDLLNYSDDSDYPEANKDLTANVTGDEIIPGETGEWLEAHAGDTGKELYQLHIENPPASQQGLKATYPTTPKKNQNFERKYQNRPNDLRGHLSDRRRQDLQNYSEDSDYPETTRDSTANAAEDEVIPDETDKWLEAHTDETGKKLNIDMECMWELADSSASRDSWYLVTSSKVLLNNIRFLSTLTVSDGRLRLLAPQEVMRGLRSATFSEKTRIAECAKRLLLTIRQNKLPNNPKDASIVEYCLELMKQNKHVVLLLNEKDLRDKNNQNVPIFSVDVLKQFLSRYSIRNDQNDTVSKIQKICENITIVVSNTTPKPENFATVITTPSPSHLEFSEISTESTPKINEISNGIDETKTQTVVSGKLTANACVQTDLVFPVMQPAEIRSIQEMKNRPAVNTIEIPNDSKAAPRKIKLKRQFQHANVTSDHDERKSFKWRKRKETGSTPNITPLLENSHKSSSCPSSLSNSTHDLASQHNDNAVDGEFSDGSLNAKLIEETSTSGVISNSMDSENMFKISKKAILDESHGSKNEKIDMYEVTNEFMNVRLKTRQDEWATRFIQIMDEVLTEVLNLKPTFVNEKMPSPWTTQEATICIKQKFESHCTIVDASDKLGGFLLRICDNKGNINADMNSKEFMQMFSYGVHLIKVLQLQLPNCDDLILARTSLFKLLSDIKEPNVDDMDETFMDDDTPDHSANLSGTVTSLSTDLPDNIVSDDKELPRSEEKRPSANNSPARYTLRSSRLNIPKKTEAEAEKSEAPCSNNNDEYSLFSSLGLQKNTFLLKPKMDTSIIKTITNIPQEQQPPTALTDLTQNLHDVRESNIVKTAETKIFRNFVICPDIENKLKNANNKYADLEQHHAQDDNSAADDGVQHNIDFTEGANVQSEHFIDKNNYSLIQTAMDVEQSCESTKSGDLDSNGIFKWVVQRTTYDFNSCLVKLRRFCEKTHEDIKAHDSWDPDYKTYVMDKTFKASVRAIKMCDLLKCILNRDASVTKSKFQDLFKMFGVDESMNDSQLSEYRLIIEKYLKHADLLLRFVSLLVDLVKEK